MEEEGGRREDLSKSIADKLALVATLRADLERKKKTSRCRNMDEQIALAELEYRLVREEMALLALQERHWEEAARPQSGETQHSENGDCKTTSTLYAYVDSIREQGVIPELHVSKSIQDPDQSLLLSSTHASLPKVEWAHPDTGLQAGDRVVEVDGETAECGRPPSGPCGLVVVRPQRRRESSGREATRLRSELTAVVARLNAAGHDHDRLAHRNDRLQKERDELQAKYHKLQLQTISLQGILLYLYRALEIKSQQQQSQPSPQNDLEPLETPILQQECPSVLDVLKKTDWTTLRGIIGEKRKGLPWLDIPDQPDLIVHQEQSEKNIA